MRVASLACPRAGDCPGAWVCLACQRAQAPMGRRHRGGKATPVPRQPPGRAAADAGVRLHLRQALQGHGVSPRRHSAGPHRMRRACGRATLMVTMHRTPMAPIDATAQRAPTNAASIPASTLPTVSTTVLI